MSEHDWAVHVASDSLTAVILDVLGDHLYADTTLAHDGEVILDGTLPLAPLVEAIETWYASR